MGVHECQCKILDADTLEYEVVNSLHRLSESEDIFDQARDTLKEISTAKDNKDEAALERARKERRLRKVQAAMKELFRDYYEDKFITREQFLKMNNEYLAEEKELHSYLEKSNLANDIYQSKVADLNLLQKQLIDLRNAWPFMSFEEKQSILRDVVKAITPREDHVELDVFFLNLKLSPSKNTSAVLVF